MIKEIIGSGPFVNVSSGGNFTPYNCFGQFREGKTTIKCYNIIK
jgi:hypothetical protein